MSSRKCSYISDSLRYMNALSEHLRVAGIVCDWSIKDDRKGESEWPTVHLCKKSGPIVSTCGLKIKQKIREKTTQGTVFVLDSMILNATDALILKVDEIYAAQKDMWIGRSKGDKMVAGSKSVHSVISSAYMDALCYEIFDAEVRTGNTIHFPIICGTGLARTKRTTRTSEGTTSCLIFMEYLQCDMVQCLTRRMDAISWYAALMQIACGLHHGNVNYNFVHNDCHANNIRVRCVNPDMMLRYRTTNGKKLSVPTFGNVYVIIDFGRSTITVPRHSMPLTSSEFYGKCVYNMLVPDNIGCDIARLAMSIEDLVHTKVCADERDELVQFLRQCCETESKGNLIDLIKSAENSGNSNMMSLYSESFTKSMCTSCTPAWVIKRLAYKFEVSEHSCTADECICFPLNIEL